MKINAHVTVPRATRSKPRARGRQPSRLTFMLLTTGFNVYDPLKLMQIDVAVGNYVALHFLTHLCSPILNLGSHVEISAFHFLWGTLGASVASADKWWCEYVRPWSGRGNSGKDKRWNQRHLQALNTIQNSVEESTGPTLLRSPVTQYGGTLVLTWHKICGVSGSGAIFPPCQQQWGYPDEGAPPSPNLPSVRWTLSPRSEPGGVVTNPGLSLVQIPSLQRVSMGLLTVGIKQRQTQHKSNVLGLGLSNVPYPSCQVLGGFKD